MSDPPPPRTPHLPSAFPATPQTQRRYNGTPRSNIKLGAALPDISAISQGKEDVEGPLIPFETLDAPQQRLYVVAFYVALLAWRMYDYSYLQEEETESLWLFMKWVMFDGIFLFGLPELRIPWLEFSSASTTILFLAHALLDGVLMFRIPVPHRQSLFEACTRTADSRPDTHWRRFGRHYQAFLRP